jgi:hypothetical protein
MTEVTGKDLLKGIFWFAVAALALILIAAGRWK